MFRGEITEFQFYQNRKAEKLIMMPFCQEDLEMHGHNFFELAYITGGTAEHTLENEGKTISAGDYFFVDYGCLHGFQNCKNLTLSFNPERGASDIYVNGDLVEGKIRTIARYCGVCSSARLMPSPSCLPLQVPIRSPSAEVQYVQYDWGRTRQILQLQQYRPSCA